MTDMSLSLVTVENTQYERFLQLSQFPKPCHKWYEPMPEEETKKIASFIARTMPVIWPIQHYFKKNSFGIPKTIIRAPKTGDLFVLLKQRCSTRPQFERALKEVLQEIALVGLWRAYFIE